MEQSNCIFCDATRTELPTGLKICDLQYSRLFLFREQLYPGRCLLVSKHHAEELYDLSPAEQAGFLSDFAKVAQTLKSLFHADKINTLSLGDGIGHLHIHIVPKCKTDPDWGKMFRLFENAHFLTEQEYKQRIHLIKHAMDLYSESFENDNIDKNILR